MCGVTILYYITKKNPKQMSGNVVSIISHFCSAQLKIKEQEYCYFAAQRVIYLSENKNFFFFFNLKMNGNILFGLLWIRHFFVSAHG